MINRDTFFAGVRQNLFHGSLKQSQVEGINAILDEWEANHAADDKRWLAYMLATTHHETAFTMQPIEEFGKGHGRPYGTRIKINKQPYSDTPAVFYGRGFVQLTWYDNYKKASDKLSVDLLHQPELALTLPVATKIMFAGMTEGWFTGVKLSTFFNAQKGDWVNARKIINGLDKADTIAGYAQLYHNSITQASQAA